MNGGDVLHSVILIDHHGHVMRKARCERKRHDGEEAENTLALHNPRLNAGGPEVVVNNLAKPNWSNQRAGNAGSQYAGDAKLESHNVVTAIHVYDLAGDAGTGVGSEKHAGAADLGDFNIALQ